MDPGFYLPRFMLICGIVVDHNFYRRTMASNQAEIMHLGELSNREQEIIGISDRMKKLSLRAGLAALLILAMAFIALPVASLFLKSPLETTFRISA